MTSKIVYVIRENGASGLNHRKITELTANYHDVEELNLEQALIAPLSSALMLIMDVAPDNYNTVIELRKILKSIDTKEVPIFFILNSMKRGEVMQANTLGAAEFLSHPIDEKEFHKKLKEIANNAIEQSWENLNPTQAAALKVSLKVFEDTFDSLKNGGPLPDKEIRESCDLLIKQRQEQALVTCYLPFAHIIIIPTAILLW